MNNDWRPLRLVQKCLLKTTMVVMVVFWWKCWQNWKSNKSVLHKRPFATTGTKFRLKKNIAIDESLVARLFAGPPPPKQKQNLTELSNLLLCIRMHLTDICDLRLKLNFKMAGFDGSRFHFECCPLRHGKPDTQTQEPPQADLLLSEGVYIWECG